MRSTTIFYTPEHPRSRPSLLQDLPTTRDIDVTVVIVTNKWTVNSYDLRDQGLRDGTNEGNMPLAPRLTVFERITTIIREVPFEL